MAMRSPGSNIPQVRSALLGPYRRRGEAGYVPPGSQGGGGGFGGFSGGQQWQQPNLSALSSKYLKAMPGIDIETDQSKLYEQQMGGYRSDVQGAMTQAGQQAISMAAQTGRDVADTMARYLPEAVKGFGRGAADVATGASQQAQQGQVAKSELELKRKGMADDMARFDAGAQQQQMQFESQLKTEYQMHRERMSNNLRVAQSQASSARELQSINNAHQMQMQQMTNQFKQKASQFAEAQANARQSRMLQTYDKWQKSDALAKQRDQALRGANAVVGAPPPIQTNQPPSQGGTGTFSYPGASGSFGGGQINYNQFPQGTQQPQLSIFEQLWKDRQANNPYTRPSYGR